MTITPQNIDTITALVVIGIVLATAVFWMVAEYMDSRPRRRTARAIRRANFHKGR